MTTCVTHLGCLFLTLLFCHDSLVARKLFLTVQAFKIILAFFKASL